MKLEEVLAELFLLLFFGVMIVGNVVRFIMWIKCYRVKECDNRNCHWARYCDKYHRGITEEELDELEKLLEERRRELKMEDKQKKSH